VSVILFPVVTPAEPGIPDDPESTYVMEGGTRYRVRHGHMCSHCGYMPFTEARCPNGCPPGSLGDDHAAVLALASEDASQLRGHVAPERIEQVERRMLGYDLPGRPS